MNLREVAALIFSAALVLPASAAPQCRVKHDGKTYFDWLPCQITADKGVITFEQGNHFTAEIKNGVLKSNIARLSGPKIQAYIMDTFDKVAANPIDGGLCYTTPKLEVCSGDSED